MTTPLRRRMLEDMRLRGLADRTQRSYVRAVADLARHFGRSPDLLTQKDLRAYFLHLIEERKLSASTVNQHRSAAKFFYQTTLGRRWPVFGTICQKRGRRLPTVLSREEVQRLFAAVRNPKHRLGMLLGYTCGLRVSEAVGLRVGDIDVERRQLHVVNGKGRKDRYVPVADRVLEHLRRYRLKPPAGPYLFPSPYYADRPLSVKTFQTVVPLCATEAGLVKRVSFHTLRHCYGTHLLECGVDLRTIQELMGHRNTETTMIYTHLTVRTRDRLGRALNEMTEDL